MRTRLFPAALACLALVGVSLVSTAAGAQTDEPTTPAAPTPPEIEVLDRGDAPRTDLRLTVPAGTTETLRMRTYARISQTVDGQTRSGSTPNIRFAIDLTVDAVGADGNLTVTYEYASIDVTESGPPGLTEATRDALEPLIGVTGTMVVTDKGALVSSDVAIPTDLAPETEQLFDQLQSQAAALTVPFPDGKVGEGARWRASSVVELGGVEFRQAVTYVVERVRDGRMTLSTELRQTAGRQEFTPPGSDESIELISSRGTGSGEMIVDPATSVLPIGGDSDVRIRQRLRADGDAISQTTSVSLFLNEDR
jgi:hypothetical protein